MKKLILTAILLLTLSQAAYGITADEYYESANSKLAGKDYKGAIADLQQAISQRTDPKYISRLNNTIKALEKKEHPEAYEYYQTGLAKYKKEDYQGAIYNFTKAIELSPGFGDYYYERASAKDNLKDHQGTLDDADHALSLNQYKSEYYYAKGSALSWFNKKGENMKKILACYQLAIIYNTNSDDAAMYAETEKEAQTLYEQMKSENTQAMGCLEFYTEEGYNGGLMLHNRCNRAITAALSSKYNSEFYVFLAAGENQRIGTADGGTEDKILRAWIYGNGYDF